MKEGFFLATGGSARRMSGAFSGASEVVIPGNVLGKLGDSRPPTG